MSKSILPADYTDAENELVEKVKEGEPWIYSAGKPELDDPAKGENWGPERTIRAEVIYALAVDDSPRVHAKGVRIRGAKIVGPLDLTGAQIPHPLGLLNCFIGEPLILIDADAISINLIGSHVAEIAADRLHTRGSVFLRIGFHAVGAVRLRGAKVGGDLNCSGSIFEGAKGDALIADGATIVGAVFMREGFHAKGEVRLVGAKIGGQLDCSGGTFENAKGYALIADGATVAGDVFLRSIREAKGEGLFQAKGEVRLMGAKIGGLLDCSHGIFENVPGCALSADRATVDGDVFLSKMFQAKGEVRLVGAKIGGQLSCVDGTFEKANGTALNLERVSVAGVLFLNVLASKPIGEVDLESARVAIVVDDEKSWPENGKLILDGFVYGRLAAEASWRARDWKDKGDIRKGRLSWLDLQPGFCPQPYEQLIRVLGEMGHEREAREVAIAKQVQWRKRGSPGFWGWLRSLFLGFTIAHGYKGGRAFILLFVVWLIGTWMFSAAERKGVMVPSEKEAYVSYQSPPFDTPMYALEAILPGIDLQIASKSLPPGYPIFHAWQYAIDTLLPGIDLHQKSKWYLRQRDSGGCWDWIWPAGSVVYFVIGWVLTLLGVGAVGGLLRPK